jgi:hypothetical protein
MSDERTPTAEPVTAMRDAIAAERFPGAPANVRAISIERLDAIIAAAQAEAAQRSTAEVERLREALTTYGWHVFEVGDGWGYPPTWYCPAWNDPTVECDEDRCGFDKARAALAEPDHDDPMVAMANSIGGTAAEPDPDDKSGPVVAWSDDEVP